MARINEAYDLGLREEPPHRHSGASVAAVDRASRYASPQPAVAEPQWGTESPDPTETLDRLVAPFRELDVVYDSRNRILWQYMKPGGRPSYTMGLLREMRLALEAVERLFKVSDDQRGGPLQYMIMGSRIPGIYNLGGDLPLFVELINAGDREGLRAYAYACIDVQYPRAVNLDLPYVSISLVQGDALGGGFEAALADDVIIAERSAKFGLPEILFGLFPGMGAYSFLSRRLDSARAERMILTGKIYSADELHELGVVDVVAEDGKGEDAVYDYIARNRRSYHALSSVYQARRIVNPVSRDELIGITDLWVEAALRLERNDLRKMERLAAAQDRRFRS